MHNGAPGFAGHVVLLLVASGVLVATRERPPKTAGPRTDAGLVLLSGASAIGGALKVAAVVAIVVFGMISVNRVRTPEFKLECAAYQAGFVEMSFPDNVLCTAFFQQG